MSDIDITAVFPSFGTSLRLTAQVTRVFAETYLNDRKVYFHGLKKGKVLSFHPVRRGLSDRQGQMEHLSFGAIIDDVDGEYRVLLESAENRYLINNPLVVRIISDEGRRQELTPRLVANGFVADNSPLPNRRFRLEGHDWMKRRFSRWATDDSTWQPRVNVAHHPNANNNSQQNIGKIVPIIYNRITDTNLITPGDPTTDNGDGQLLPIYAGDETIAGDTYAIGLIAAHHCAEIEAGFMNPGAEQGVDLEADPDWLTPRRAAAWLAAGFDTPWRTRGNQDYCEIYLKGGAGNMLRAMRDASGEHIAVNVAGRTDTGDDEGELLTDGFDILYDFMRNYVAGSWTSGPPLPVPQFPTVPIKVLNLASFNRCRAQVLTRLTDGYPLHFALGAANASWRLGDVIAEFHKCLDVEGFIDHAGRYAIDMEPSALPATFAPKLTDVKEIIRDGLTITDKNKDFFNVQPYRHTYDYCGRMQAQFSTPWRSQMSGDLERRHQTSIDRYEQERSAATLEFAFIRGKNRSVDSDYYEGGTEAAIDIATRVLNRYANPRRSVQVLTSLNGTSHEPGSISKLTSIDGVGLEGWADRNIRWNGHELLPSGGRVLLDGYDLDAVLEAQETS